MGQSPTSYPETHEHSPPIRQTSSIHAPPSLVPDLLSPVSIPPSLSNIIFKQTIQTHHSEYIAHITATLTRLKEAGLQVDDVEHLVKSDQLMHAFSVSTDFFNQSPRGTATPIPVMADAESRQRAEQFLKNKQQNTVWGSIRQTYRNITEPLVDDPALQYLYYLEDKENREHAEKLASLRGKEKDAEIKAHEKKLAAIEHAKTDETDGYCGFMEVHRIHFLKTYQQKLIEHIKTLTSDIHAELDDILAIEREKDLKTCNDCIDNYDRPKKRLDRARKKIAALNKTDEEKQTLLELLDNLQLVCNHYNDACYERPLTYTKLEIAYAAIKSFAAFVGGCMSIFGYATTPVVPPVGLFFIGLGVAVATSPQVIEAVFHSIHCAFHGRGPDSKRWIQALTSTLTAPLEVLGAPARVVSAVVRQLFVSVRQTGRDFLVNMIPSLLHAKTFKKRFETRAKWKKEQKAAKETVLKPVHAPMVTQVVALKKSIDIQPNVQLMTAYVLPIIASYALRLCYTAISFTMMRLVVMQPAIIAQQKKPTPAVNKPLLSFSPSYRTGCLNTTRHHHVKIDTEIATRRRRFSV